MLHLSEGLILNQVDENSDIISLKGCLSVLPLVSVSSRLRLLRSCFLDEATKSYALCFSLLPGPHSRHLNDLLIVVALSQVFDKTHVRFYLEGQPKPGFLARNAGYACGLVLMKSFCNFRTFVKHQDAIENSIIPDFIPV